MKKFMFVVAGAAAVLFSGCTTVESTQVFNRMGLGTPNEKAVCQTYVEIPGYFLFGLPIITGSPRGDGEWSMFRYNLTTKNVVHLLTKEAKERQAARVMNVQVSTSETMIFPPFLSKKTIQASGTGIRSRGAAINRAATAYDDQP